ncbi:hypothetical protein GCM10010306_099930 [Streptomyces umbrinus]|nr:hypothetical protein GCM10010306_099930 [Streptomyces umbrinus]
MNQNGRKSAESGSLRGRLCISSARKTSCSEKNRARLLLMKSWRVWQLLARAVDWWSRAPARPGANASEGRGSADSLYQQAADVSDSRDSIGTRRSLYGLNPDGSPAPPWF